jgi:uncharacterized membrane protein YkvI
MRGLYKIAYWLGTALLIVFIWNVILPDDMDTGLKMRFISYPVLIGIMIYFAIKNIGGNKKDDG